MDLSRVVERLHDAPQDTQAQPSDLRVRRRPPRLVEDSRAFADESLNQLYDAIRQLSEVDRAVILLYLDEKLYREIGEIIGTNPNNVGVRINRIKDRLRRLLDEKDNRSDVA